ncbi:MAG: LapD/MoxY N-terminal periplasmic domain-containing protein [Pseudomonadota bacterium]
MTLTKQLWLAIAAIMSFAFGIGLLVSVWSAKNYLEEQLRLKNIDNANLLALSISQVEKDPVLIELLVSAQFDIGHYRQIRLTSPAGEVMVERVSDAPADGVPDWFIRLIPLHADPGIAQVQSGWNQYGTLTVVSDDSYAYQSLWKGNVRLLGWFLLGALLYGVIGTLILRSVTRPLREVVKQAEAIGARRFHTIPEPRTHEFRILVRAMNVLSDRVRSMLEEEAAQLERLRRDAQYDAVTGLMNREHFINKVQAALSEEDAALSGSLFILRLIDLIGMNRELGREATDVLLKRVAASLQASCPDASCLVGRLNGSDFAVLAPDADAVAELAQRIYANALLAMDGVGVSTGHVALLGGTAYHHGDTVSRVLSYADLALGRAAQEGGSAVETGAGADAEWRMAPSMAAGWRSLIETALERRLIRFETYPVLDRQRELLHYEAPARVRHPESELLMSAREFMPWVSRLGLVERIDAAVFERALEWLEGNPGQLCINLSAQSVCNAQAHGRFAAALAGRRQLAERLWIDIPEFVAYRHAGEFRGFCGKIKPLGCKIGLEHVGSLVGRMGELYDVGLDYLKIDSAIIRDIDHSMGNQTFLRGLCTIAHAMGMIVIAEGVSRQEESACLLELGFNAVTGPAVRLNESGA